MPFLFLDLSLVDTTRCDWAMKHLHGLSLACLVGLAAFSTAADISYVTDLEIFTYLVCLLDEEPEHDTDPLGAMCFQCHLVQCRDADLLDHVRRLGD